MADRLHGQCVAAYVLPADESLSVEELKAHCARHPMLPPYKRPRFYTLVEELPHTATGKLLHYKLREQAARRLNERAFLRECPLGPDFPLKSSRGRADKSA